MASRRQRVPGGVVQLLGLELLRYEGVPVFLAVSGTIPAGVVELPLLVVAIPFAIAVALVLVRFGAGVLDAVTLR